MVNKYYSQTYLNCILAVLECVEVFMPEHSWAAVGECPAPQIGSAIGCMQIKWEELRVAVGMLVLADL